MGCFVRFPYDEQSHLEVMDTMFFVGVNAGLLILLIFGLVSAKAKTARYWDVVVGDQVITNAVWAYDTPKPEAESIRERFAFYRNKGVTLA